MSELVIELTSEWKSPGNSRFFVHRDEEIGGASFA